MVVVASKQWGSYKTVSAWTVGQQDALSGYNCTLQGPTPAKLEIRVFPSLLSDSSTSSRLGDLLPETKCSAAVMEAAAMLLLMQRLLSAALLEQCMRFSQMQSLTLASNSTWAEMPSDVQFHRTNPAFTTGRGLAL